MTDENVAVSSNPSPYLAKPVLEWLRERVDGSLAGTKFKEAIEEIEQARRTGQFWKDEKLAADAEIERLRADLASANEQLADQTVRWGAVVDERDRLRAALVKHGTHTAGCSNARYVGECSCGLWSSLRGADETTAKPYKPGFTQACSSFSDDPDAPSCCCYCGQPREAHPPQSSECPKCEAVRKLGLTSCFEHKQAENGDDGHG